MLSGRTLFYVVLVLIFVGAMIYAFVYFRSNMRDPMIAFESDYKSDPNQGAAVPVAQPKVSFSKPDKDKLLVTWSDLPETITSLSIYRSKSSGTKGAFWKEINISSPSGSAKFDLSPADSAIDYYYYTEGRSTAASPTEPPIWSFPSTPAAPIPLAPTSTAPAPVTPPPAPNPTSTPPVVLPSSTPTTTPTTTPSVPSSTGPSTSTITYYTPEIQISTTTSILPPAEHFGLAHRDNKINIWWYGLPQGADSFLISRAPSVGGPWLDLLRQSSPRPSDSFVVLDNTLHDDQYYRMEVMRDGMVMANYGPLLLPGLPN